MKVGWLLLLMLVACAQSPVQEEQKVAESKPPVPTLQTTNTSIHPGKVKYFEFPVPLADGKNSIVCDKQKLPILVRSYVAKVYLAESYFSSRKSYKCYLESNKTLPVLSVNVVPFKYPQERLNVDKKKIDLSKEDLARVIEENKIKARIYLSSADNFLFSKPFQIPLNSFITSHYGTKRVFNNKKNSQHLGNDFRAAVGVPIPVSNDGKVVYAGDLFFSGNVVVVDHGLDIFTMYAHLSAINVKEGDTVTQGQIIGKAGKTGRVSGPHLHWGVRIGGHWVDGFSLAEESKALASR